jgi:hypothetical protein
MPTPAARETEPMTRTPLDPLMNPAMIPPPEASSVDLSDSDLVVEDSATDMGAQDNLGSTAERAASLDFIDNEHTEFRPFVPPPENEENVVVVDDMAEEVTDGDDKKPSAYPRG